VCEEYNTLSLDLMKLEIHSIEAETVKGVPVSVTGVSQIKVLANKMLRQHADGSPVTSQPGEDEEDVEWVMSPEQDLDKILLAAQHFLGATRANIQDSLRSTMEGHQRQILGTLTVEELYKDRAKFSSRVREHVTKDLMSMGFYLVSYTVTAIKDNSGYMKALGETQTALVKREAEEGTAKNEAEARKKVAQYKSDADIESAKADRGAHVSVNQQKQEEAQSDRNLGMKQATYEKEINQARAEARLASDIATAKQRQEVIREETKQQLEKEQVMINVVEKEVERKKIDAEGVSSAALMRQINESKGVRVEAEAESARITSLGNANAAAVQLRGTAEADVMKSKAEAFKQYGEAAVVQSIIERMPEICAAVAAPMGQCEKMVFISQDGGGSKLNSDIINLASGLPDALEGLTGVNLRAALEKLAKDQGGANVN
jgi:flotillin